jgi:transcriptional regulator with XRE-family HTH domain
MNNNFVGEIIFSLRTEAKLSQESLGRGILHNRELSRIENGTRIPDKLTLDALFQRLGKSADRIARVLTNQEYELIFLREKMESSLIYEELINFQKYKCEYDKKKRRGSNLSEQYFLMIEVISLFLERKMKGDYHAEFTEEISILKTAIEITFCEWEEKDYLKYCLCVQELQILSMLGYYMYLSGDADSGKKILEKVKLYSELRFEDEQELSKIYPHALYYLSQISYLESNYSIAIKYCDIAMQNLIRYGDIVFVKKILILQEKCYFELNEKNGSIKIDQYTRLIEKILKESKLEYEISDFAIILLSSLQSDFTLCGELVRNYRIAEGISQEEFSWEICSSETLSRIERGRRAPQPAKFYKMVKKLELNRDFFGGYIVSNKYEDYINVSNFTIALQENDLERAERCLSYVRSEVDESVEINKQFIDAGSIVIKIKRNEISADEGIEEMKRILKYTGINDIYQLIHVPSREESFIINQIGVCLKKKGKYAEAIKLYESAIKTYDDTIISEKFLGPSLLVLLTGYSGALEENGQIEDALKVSNRVIRLSVLIRRSGALSTIFANRSCIYEKKYGLENTNLAVKALKNAYLLALSFNNLYKADIYNKHCENVYHVSCKDE